MHKANYKLELKYLQFITFPYVFSSHQNELIINLQAKPKRQYRSSGLVEQILIDYPNQIVIKSQPLRFNNQLLYFEDKGRFQLRFRPNYYLGNFTISIKINEQKSTCDICPKLDRIEQKVNDISEYGT